MVVGQIFSAIILANTYFWFGGQGYCSYDFAILHDGTGYTDVEIVLRPVFDPDETMSGRTELDDNVIAIENLGGGRVFSTASDSIETDCSVKEFALISASGLNDSGQRVDLISAEGFEFEDYEPVKLQVQP